MARRSLARPEVFGIIGKICDAGRGSWERMLHYCLEEESIVRTKKPKAIQRFGARLGAVKSHSDMKAINREFTITWFDDPRDAEADLDAHHAGMTPSERVEQTMQLMIVSGGWKPDGRLERTAQFVGVAQS